MELNEMEPLIKAIEVLLDNWDKVLEMAEELMGEDYDDDLAGDTNDFLETIVDDFDFRFGEEPAPSYEVAPELEEILGED